MEMYNLNQWEPNRHIFYLNHVTQVYEECFFTLVIITHADNAPLIRLCFRACEWFLHMYISKCL